MSLTPAQQEAVAARGNVLVIAGAGTGKTSTLVARCLHCLLEENPPASLEQLLLVTFTDAAAADMRRRIRAEFESRILQVRLPETAIPPDAFATVSETALREKQREVWLTEQLAFFDIAHIGTLHSFCLQLVRQHFYELGLDPQLAVLPEEEARLLADETLDKILQGHYAGNTAQAGAVLELIQNQGRSSDQEIRALVLKLHHYTQTLRDPSAWFGEQLDGLESPEPVQWRSWLSEGINDWRSRWLPALQAVPPDNEKAQECAALLQNCPAPPTREIWAGVLEAVGRANQEWPRGKITAWRKPLEGFFEEAAFLHSLARLSAGGGDPLAEDWKWMRPLMAALLQLAREFASDFTEAKRELGMVDFHDLEQHALELLWDRKTNQPTAVAQQWRNQLRFVFVDEYQDINDAQDAILKALSREGADANRFLVGDVKQSIYRFRLADPHIFQNYVAAWSAGDGRVIPLVDNFRSRESILQFVNSVFGSLMRREVGGVPYDAAAQLRFGDPANRQALSRAENPAPNVELHLRLKGSPDHLHATEDDGDAIQAGAELTNLEEAEKEARLVALRLRELADRPHFIWDEAEKRIRQARWGDMAVLLRSPSRKAESYAKEFARLGVPLLVSRGGFYESTEITDLLSLLQLLDNPLQDLPLLAVLHSPLVGMTLDELALLRLTVPKGAFWLALQQFHRNRTDHSGWRKADRFLKYFADWRLLARRVSLSRCLETVLTQTHYADWLLTQPRGEQRRANTQRLLALAQQFDQFQRQGLFRFLKFIKAQQEAETEPDVAVVPDDNAVSLMSIHQSKGLEFPIVVVADLGKSFNLSDLRAEIILDERFGLCPQIKPPQTGQRYPSLPYWLARQRQRRETLGEELRLLYVAMTRARDTLILAGTIPAKTFDRDWQDTEELTTAAVLGARNYLDWLAAWSTQSAATLLAQPDGANALLRWKIYEDDRHLLGHPAPPTIPSDAVVETTALNPFEWKKLQQRLDWRYPHAGATQQTAKTSVTVLRRRAADESDAEDEMGRVPNLKFQISDFKSQNRGGLSAAEAGTAHHTFLQWVSLDQAGGVTELQAEAARMEARNILTEKEAESLDFPALAAFWQSDLGRRICAQRANVRRELAFTARFSPEELAGATPKPPDFFEEEFVVVQGVVDLAVLVPDEIWVVDFKTDSFGPADLADKVELYEPQLRLYAQALTRIYQRPVTELQLHFLAVRRSVPLAVAGGRPVRSTIR